MRRSPDVIVSTWPSRFTIVVAVIAIVLAMASTASAEEESLLTRIFRGGRIVGSKILHVLHLYEAGKWVYDEYQHSQEEEQRRRAAAAKAAEERRQEERRQWQEAELRRERENWDRPEWKATRELWYQDCLERERWSAETACIGERGLSRKLCLAIKTIPTRCVY